MSKQPIQEVQLPSVDREIVVPASRYECSISNDVYRQAGYSTMVSTNLVHAPNASYEQMLSMLPKGYRMGVPSDTVSELLRLEKQYAAKGESPREALKDSLFATFVEGRPYKWERTHVFLRAIKGVGNLGAYKETDDKGREYLRGDFGIGEKVVAEGVRLPNTRGGKVVEWNEALGIPAVVSDGNEPNHTTHLYVNPDLSEVAVDLCGYWYSGEQGRCLGFDAGWGRSDSNEDAAFRLVQGSLDDLLLPIVEKAD